MDENKKDIESQGEVIEHDVSSDDKIKESNSLPSKPNPMPTIIGAAIGAVVLIAVVLAVIFGGNGNDKPDKNDEPEHVHSFGKWSTVEKATCAVEGRQERSCECGEVETKAINKTDDHDFGSWETTKKATCAKDGEKERECEICGETESKSIPKVEEHSFVANGRVEPDCTTDGSSDSIKCEICDLVEYTGYTIFSPGHQPGEWIIDRDPSDQANGMKHKECTVCQKVVEQEIIPMINVSYFEYKTFPDGEIGITKYTGRESYVVVPTTIGGKRVKGLEDNAFTDNTYVETVIISEGITSFKSYIFARCTNLKTVVLPDSISKTYGIGMFYQCSSLTDVTLSKNMIYIKEETFYGCTSLKSIEIPEGITRIDTNAFDGCTSLTAVSIPSSVQDIYENAFFGCVSLSSVYYGESYEFRSINLYAESTGNECLLDYANWYYEGDFVVELPVTDYIVDGLMLTRNDTGWTVRMAESELDDADITINIFSHYKDIPVTEIAAYGFAYCDRIKAVTLPDTITSIGDYAFYDCSGLEIICIPISISSLGTGAFQNCSSLEECIFVTGSSISYISENAFAYCESLEKIWIPGKVTRFGDGAFIGCYSLTKIYYADSESMWGGIDKGAYNEVLYTSNVLYGHIWK